MTYFRGWCWGQQFCSVVQGPHLERTNPRHKCTDQSTERSFVEKDLEILMDNRLNTGQQFPGVAAMERSPSYCEHGQTLGQADQRDWRVSIVVDIWSVTGQSPQKPVLADSALSMWGELDFLQIWTFLWFSNDIHVFLQAHAPDEHV